MTPTMLRRWTSYCGAEAVLLSTPFVDASFTLCKLRKTIINAMDIQIESMHVVGRWSWDIKGEDTCGICRLLFDAACAQCKAPGDDCPIVTGKCTHSFHIHCIEKWMERGGGGGERGDAPLCPMCRGEWDFAA